MSDQIWYEDFIPGRVLTSAPRKITLADIDDYARLTGEDHPVHMDDIFAREAGFAGRITHGLFNLALIEGLKAGLGLFDRSVTASLGWSEIKFSAPLYPGEEVHLRLECVARRMTSKPGRGLATERGYLIKADGTEVVRGDHLIFLLTRPAGAVAAEGVAEGVAAGAADAAPVTAPVTAPDAAPDAAPVTAADTASATAAAG